MLSVLLIKARLVSIEGVAILHRKFPDPDQASPGTGIIPPLRLNLVDELGHFLIAVDFKAGDISNDLFVGHRKDHVTANAVVEATHLFIDRVEAPSFFPDIGGVHHRHENLLAPNGIHLFADNLFNLFY